SKGVSFDARVEEFIGTGRGMRSGSRIRCTTGGPGRRMSHNGKTGVPPMTLQQLLGIELPIIQAPMAGVQGQALAVAVSNAGGLGSLPCAMLSLDAMRKELAAI